MLDTVVMSGDDVCCSAVFGTLVGVFGLSVMWSELLMTSAIICPLWSSVYECHKVECAFTSPVRTECGMFVIYCMQCCMSVSAVLVRGCGVSRRYIDVCYCDMFSVVNVYLDHLKFCVVCINSRRYVCCNECNEPTSCLVQPIGVHCCEVMYFGCVVFRDELGFLNCDVCMCVVNKQFELIEFVSESVYVDCDACTVVCVECVCAVRVRG